MVGMHDIDVLQLSLLEIFYRILQVCSLAPWQRVLQGMANRGGARHFAKSVVEVGALKKVLSDYESIAKPSLNKTRFVGAVWVQLRQERIVVLLNHIRRLARDPKFGNAVNRLTSLEYGRLMEVLNQVSLEEDEEETLLSKGPAKPLQKPLPKGAKRKLQRVVSEDSEGFPQMLVSPTKGGEGGPKALLRPGHRARARALQKADSGGGESIDPQAPWRRRIPFAAGLGTAIPRARRKSGLLLLPLSPGLRPL
eukprot:s1336_g5.t1